MLVRFGDMDLPVHILDGFDIDILVEKIPQAVQVLKTHKSGHGLDFIGNSQLFNRFDFSENTNEVIHRVYAEAFKFTHRADKRQHIEDFKGGIGHRRCRKPVDPTAVIKRPQIMRLDCHVHGNLRRRRSRQVCDALRVLPRLHAIFEIVSLINDDAVEAHILQKGEFLLLLSPLIAVFCLDIGKSLVFGVRLFALFRFLSRYNFRGLFLRHKTA